MNEKKVIFPEQQDMFRGELGKLILSKDWSRSSIGEIQNWPESLNLFVRLCLNSNVPATVWWGNEFLQIYNDAFGKIFNVNHSELLGANGRENSKLWNILGDALRAVYKDGIPNRVTRKVTLTFNDTTEEREFTFDQTPIIQTSGTVGVFT